MIDMPSRESCSSLSISSCMISSTERKSPVDSPCATSNSMPLGVLDQLVRLARRSATRASMSVRDAEQPAQRGLVLDDLRVVARVAGGRHDRRQLVHVGLAAGLLELAALLELGADGERVDRLVLVVEREDRRVDRRGATRGRSRRAAAAPRPAPSRSPPGDQHRPEHGLLGLEVLRRDRPVAAGVRGYRQGAAHGQSLGVHDHRLHRCRDAGRDLDLDHVGAQLPDRLVEAHLAVVELEAARLAGRRRRSPLPSRSRTAAVVTGAVRDREHGLAEQRGGLLRALLLLARGRLGCARARAGPPRSTPSVAVCASRGARGSCAGSPARRPRRSRPRRGPPRPSGGSPGPRRPTAR